MPTISWSGPYRIYFYSSDRGEPRHVHIDRDDCSAKVWLDPVQLDASVGFGRTELTRIEALVAERATEFRKAWDDFFSR